MDREAWCAVIHGVSKSWTQTVPVEGSPRGAPSPGAVTAPTPMLRPRARRTQPRRRTEPRSPCSKSGSTPGLMRFSTQCSEAGAFQEAGGGQSPHEGVGAACEGTPTRGVSFGAARGGCRLSPEAEMRPFPRNSAAQLFITKTVSNFSCSFRSWFSAQAPAGGVFCFLFYFLKLFIFSQLFLLVGG